MNVQVWGNHGPEAPARELQKARQTRRLSPMPKPGSHSVHMYRSLLLLALSALAHAAGLTLKNTRLTVTSADGSQARSETYA
jgi:hypothetical protein